MPFTHISLQFIVPIVFSVFSLVQNVLRLNFFTSIFNCSNHHTHTVFILLAMANDEHLWAEYNQKYNKLLLLLLYGWWTYLSEHVCAFALKCLFIRCVACVWIKKYSTLISFQFNSILYMWIIRRWSLFCACIHCMLCDDVRTKEARFLLY